MTQQPNLNLYIEELHLQGARGNPAQIQAAVEQELARLFAESGNPSTLQPGYNYANLNHHPMIVKPGSVDSIAAQVAQQIYSGLSSNP